ncbi:hypothetical protein [Pseudoalteromonas obscura]|uniref:Uncharacterized protein n=1 Tax=Pseudoalteromonas obscura TaxID=3048491 RepID=A0ABT7ET38_9GAMM|nr:hypothetical protein [Pseudoalteromonas sp. P94(2023)]MDK2598173.1 hypothetical protein [Pseudoalteromonas sp. P94(2023)]
MSKGKKRVRWRRVRVFKPYNYYYPLTVKAPHTDPQVVQKQRSNEVVEGEVTTAEPIAQLGADLDKVIGDSHEPPSMQVDEHNSDILDEAPLALFEPGQNPYIFYLQQVPVMLQGLPDEVAIMTPVESAPELLEEPIHAQETQVSHIQCEEKCEPRQAPAAQDSTAELGQSNDIYRDEGYFLNHPQRNTFDSANTRQGVKAPQLADLPARFGGHQANRSTIRSHIATLLSRHLQALGLTLNEFASWYQSPVALAHWVADIPLNRLAQICKPYQQIPVQKITIGQFLSSCAQLQHGDISLAKLTKRLLPILAVYHHQYLSGSLADITQIHRDHVQNSNAPLWLLQFQNNAVHLYESAQGHGQREPYPVCKDGHIDWQQPSQVVLFSLPNAFQHKLELEYLAAQQVWQPLLEASLLEFIHSQQCLPD